MGERDRGGREGEVGWRRCAKEEKEREASEEVTAMGQETPAEGPKGAVGSRQGGGRRRETVVARWGERRRKAR